MSCFRGLLSRLLLWWKPSPCGNIPVGHWPNPRKFLTWISINLVKSITSKEL